MAAKTFTMTAAGKAELEAELEQLRTEGRIDIAEKLKVARSYGDLSENSEYDEAKSEQAKIEARIQELEYQLENAVIIDSVAGDHVSMGSKVTVVRDGKEFVYEIVGFSQSDPSNGKISDESPVGKALMGASIGEKVTVEAPIGTLEFEIKSID
ncbi:MAG: transcription elongation factor GreA [Eubacteriales bacterium]|nr:transcription elongation factor GreA [Eubacteriales bacterium]